MVFIQWADVVQLSKTISHNNELVEKKCLFWFIRQLSLGAGSHVGTRRRSSSHAHSTLCFPLIQRSTPIYSISCRSLNQVTVSVVKLVENHNWLIGRISCILPTVDRPKIESEQIILNSLKWGTKFYAML